MCIRDRITPASCVVTNWHFGITLACNATNPQALPDTINTVRYPHLLDTQTQRLPVCEDFGWYLDILNDNLSLHPLLLLYNMFSNADRILCDCTS